MSDPLWLTDKLVYSLHDMLIQEHGGLSGVRDEGLLLSALGNAKNIHHYNNKADISDLAASYAFSIIQNHPFVDGNKRTGFLCAYTFLDSNGYELLASEIDAAQMTLDLASGDVSEKEYALWLQKEMRQKSRERNDHDDGRGR